MDIPVLTAAKSCNGSIMGCEGVSCVAPEEGATVVQPVDCVSTTPADLAEENFHWLSDSAGTPLGFLPFQHEGHIGFQWTDSSQCETAFSLTRDGASFLADYPHDSEQKCGQHIEPEAHYDDLRIGLQGQDGPRLPGTLHKYCIAAVATVGAGAASNAYASNNVCRDYRVQFESIVLGQVMMKALPHLGVPDVKVTYRVHSTGESKTVISDCNGQFKLHFLFDTLAPGRLTEQVTLFFSKTSQGFQHLFECAGQPCGPGADEHGIPYPPARQTLTLEHMEMARPLEVYEQSSVKFSGKVSFPQISSPYTVLAGANAPTTWPFSKYIGPQCYMADVEVCLHEFPTEKEVICAVTEKDGSYSLNAPVGLHVFARVKSQRNSEEVFARSGASRSEDKFVRTVGGTSFVVSRAIGDANQAEAKQSNQLNNMKTKIKADEDAGGEVSAEFEEELFYISPEQPEIWKDMDYEDHTGNACCNAFFFFLRQQMFWFRPFLNSDFSLQSG